MDVHEKTSSRLSPVSLVAYGVLALPLAFSGLPIFIYAPDFYTTGHGVNLKSMGLFLLGIRLLDAIQDPVIGALSDRCQRRRTSFIIGGLVILATGFGMLYNPPRAFPPLQWFVLSMLLAAFGFSTVSINYNALGSLWSDKPREKTVIVATREGIGLIGLLLATLTPALLRLRLPAVVAFHVYSALFLALAAVAIVVFSKWASTFNGRAIQPVDSLHDRAPLDLRGIFQRSFVALFIVYGLSTFASSIPGVLVIFFIRDRLQAESLTGLFLATYFIAGIVGMPLWSKLAGRLGKIKTWRLAMVLSLFCFVGAYWLRPGDVGAYGAICFFSGLALGAELTLPLSIASDIIDQHKGQAITSSVFAVLLFTSKLSLAIASGSAFLFLSHSLYTPGTLPSTATASALSTAYALIPSGIKLLAVGASYFLEDKESSGQEKRRTAK